LSAKPTPIEPLGLRPEHAATALQISRRTLWDWIRAGRVEVARPSPGITLVLMDSIRKLIEPVEPPAE
jgi:predicted site-specific integrase-resolvase